MRGRFFLEYATGFRFLTAAARQGAQTLNRKWQMSLSCMT
jgi:hypothetical protein